LVRCIVSGGGHTRLPLALLTDAAKQGNAIKLKAASGRHSFARAICMRTMGGMGVVGRTLSRTKQPRHSRRRGHLFTTKAAKIRVIIASSVRGGETLAASSAREPRHMPQFLQRGTTPQGAGAHEEEFEG
jgi:hypothetical protein